MIRQRGVALIVVLLVLAMMTIMASSMLERLQRHFYRVESQRYQLQTLWYGNGMESLAKVAIEQSLKDSDTVNLSQVWATKGQRYPLDGGEVEGDIIDQRACFNLNSFAALKSSEGNPSRPFLLQYFQMVLEAMSVESFLAGTIADNTWEFLDQNETVQSLYGGEDSLYEGFSPPYVVANQNLSDVSEWRAIQGVSGDIYQKVVPLLCALPEQNFLLNVNTLENTHAALLSALFTPYLSVSDATSILSDRPYDGWNSVNEFLRHPILKVLSQESVKTATPFLSVSSNYFQLDAEVTVDRVRTRVVSLFERQGDHVFVVRRYYGGSRERIAIDPTQS